MGCGLTRWQLENRLKSDKKLICHLCRERGQEIRRPSKNKNKDVASKKCNADKCTNRNICAKADFLVCQRCFGQYYKRQQCSEMSRQKADTVNRTLWICPACTEEEHHQLQVNVPESETEQEMYKQKARPPTSKYYN